MPSCPLSAKLIIISAQEVEFWLVAFVHVSSFCLKPRQLKRFWINSVKTLLGCTVGSCQQSIQIWLTFTKVFKISLMIYWPQIDKMPYNYDSHMSTYIKELYKDLKYHVMSLFKNYSFDCLAHVLAWNEYPLLPIDEAFTGNVNPSAMSCPLDRTNIRLLKNKMCDFNGHLMVNAVLPCFIYNNCPVYGHNIFSNFSNFFLLISFNYICNSGQNKICV